MDVLGSILKRMEKPPQILNAKEKEQLKKQNELIKKQKEEEQMQIQKFREMIREKIANFIESEFEEKLVFQPMNKGQRAICHDIAENCHLPTFSFGEEDIDRHIICFKETPCDAELSALRKGEEYDPNKIEEPEVEEDDDNDEERSNKAKALKRSKKEVPEYQKKYHKHFGGLTGEKEAAKSTSTTRSYGFVSSEQKRDKRTIEETLADIRARKKMKSNDDNN